MKNIYKLLMVASIFLLVSCGETHRYDVEYTKCTGEVKHTTLVIENRTSNNDGIQIYTDRQAVPIMLIHGHEKILNVCEYKILEKYKLTEYGYLKIDPVLGTSKLINK